MSGDRFIQDLVARHPELANPIRDALDVLKNLTEDESCDHSVNICWCGAFAARDGLAELLGEREA